MKKTFIFVLLSFSGFFGCSSNMDDSTGKPESGQMLSSGLNGQQKVDTSRVTTNPITTGTNQLATTTNRNAIMREQQTTVEHVDDYFISAEWGRNRRLGLLTVTIAHPEKWEVHEGDAKVRVFDNKGLEIQCEPSPGAASVGNGNYPVVSTCLYFKITTNDPESLAKVEITYKNKVHLLELHDVP